MITGLLFVAGLVLVVAGSELFTNAVEWAGFRLNLARGATGSLLAALGTSLPETVVPIVALISRQPTADAVATGAVIGAPFLLVTLGVAITGVAVVARRRKPVLTLDVGQVRRDLGTFLGAFWILLVAVVLPHWARAIGAVVLLVIYARYVLATLGGSAPAEEMPEPLHILRFDEDRRGRPNPVAIAVQLLIAFAALIIGAQLFVAGLDRLATAINVSPLLLSLVLVPIATELPETLNSVIWVRAGSDGLAFGNIVGSIAFQSCLLGALGLAFTSWSPGRFGVINLGLTFATGLYTLALLHDGRCRGWRLIFNAVPWLGYVVAAALGGAPAPG